MTSISNMDLPDVVEFAATASNKTWVSKAAIRAALQAMEDCGMAIMAEGVVCEGDISPIFQKGIFIRLDNADERKRKESKS